jgi:hypothetical protein
MLTFTLIFGRLQLCFTPEFLRGTLLSALCLAALGCGHGQIHSKQMSVPAPAISSGDLMQVAAGFNELFLHDNCTAQYPPQPDTCLHDRLHEQSFTFGGKPGTVYNVTLRIRGIFEPTTILGGDTPDPAHPYFKAGGTVSTGDWSQWGIEVSEPKQTYWPESLSLGRTHHLQGGLRGNHRSGSGCSCCHPGCRRERSADRQWQDRAGSAADHFRGRRSSPRRPDVAYRPDTGQNKIRPCSIYQEV